MKQNNDFKNKLEIIQLVLSGNKKAAKERLEKHKPYKSAIYIERTQTVHYEAKEYSYTEWEGLYKELRKHYNFIEIHEASALMNKEVGSK